eukprot:TRINITY_DN9893_c0_g1_i1.p1 TRINITY_DN9893_c0_g1~~TRINITY_DN9893_c0_g1_i1.p1  ORF type:complete len:566 (+),score=110.77 TRINITY_DN9893_c0_g1_i1:36-1700(+)
MGDKEPAAPEEKLASGFFPAGFGVSPEATLSRTATFRKLNSNNNSANPSGNSTFTTADINTRPKSDSSGSDEIDVPDDLPDQYALNSLHTHTAPKSGVSVGVVGVPVSVEALKPAPLGPGDHSSSVRKFVPEVKVELAGDHRKSLHRKAHSVSDLVELYERNSSPSPKPAGGTDVLRASPSSSLSPPRSKQQMFLTQPTKAFHIPANATPEVIISEYQKQCETLTKRVEELEQATSRLINEGQMWRYRANRNKALYVQILRALADEGISVQVEGDRADFSDEEFPDSPRSVADEKKYSGPAGPFLEDQPLLTTKVDTAELDASSWLGAPVKTPSSRVKAATMGRSARAPELDLMNASTNIYGTMKSKKSPRPESTPNPNPNHKESKEGKENIISPNPVSVQEDELPENGVTNEDDLALAVVAENLRQTKDNLPKVHGFLQKKSPTILRGWQKRFFWVKDFKLYYAPNEVDTNTIVEEEKMNAEKGWNAISLVTIQTISSRPDDGEFQIRARDPRTGQMRNYVLKADSMNDRDRWVRDLNTHRDHLMSTLRWAGA